MSMVRACLSVTSYIKSFFVLVWSLCCGVAYIMFAGWMGRNQDHLDSVELCGQLFDLLLITPMPHT